MTINLECRCGQKLTIPVEQKRVKTSKCPNCGTNFDANIYLHSYRTDEYCCHNDLVRCGSAEQTDPCNPVLCKGKGECKCKTKKSVLSVNAENTTTTP